MAYPEHLGDFRRGDFLPLLLQTSPSGALGWPDAAPIVSVFDSTGLILREKMAADAQGLPPGHFRLGIFMDASFPPSGWIWGHCQWDDGTIHATSFTARILPGGSTNGSVIAMKYVKRPADNAIIYQTDGGFVLRGTNPRT